MHRHVSRRQPGVQKPPSSAVGMSMILVCVIWISRFHIVHVSASLLCNVQMMRAGELLGMAMSYIVPVRNYSSQLELDDNTDILLLKAVDHILQYADLYFQDTVVDYKVIS